MENSNESILNSELLEIMRDVHVIKSALYLDTTLVSNNNVTRQLGRLNDLTEKLLALYEKQVGQPAPKPASVLKPVYPGTIKNYHSLRKHKPKVEESDPEKPKRKRGRPRKTMDEKIETKLKQLKKKAKKKKYKQTRKVRASRKTTSGQTP